MSDRRRDPTLVADDAIEPTDTKARLAEAEDALRAIGAGEVDAFVLPDEAGGPRVFSLETADRPYRIFVENMRDGAATVSSAGVILFANRRLAELLSCQRDTIVGSQLSRFLTCDPPMELEATSGPGGAGATVELDLLDADGRAVAVLVGASSLVVGGEHLSCLTFTDLRHQRAQAREIADLVQEQTEKLAQLEGAQAMLVSQATHDSLTGLPNRALVVDRIEQALSLARRSERCTAVFFVDLDGFKQINDTRGHTVGDDVLQHVAAQLTALLRPMDTVARIGGDEFVLLAVDVDDHVHAVDIGNRVVSALLSARGRVKYSERVAASVGISISDRGRGTAELLIHEADTAMYKAKTRGGARVEVFDEALGRSVEERASVQLSVQSALDERRTIVHYQPIINLAAPEVAGFEALARIVERDGQLVPPNSFIPVAEDSGLIVPLGAHVLRLACDEAQSWQSARHRHGPLTVAVNVSARQLAPGNLATIIRRCLEDAELAGSLLHLELTETKMIDLHADVVRQLVEIRDLGVEIGLDDFGTGYASLTHLRRLPLSFVKIDKSFVQGVDTDRQDEEVVSSVIALAAHLGLRSIAEGVEEEGQLDRLREFGCDQAQGYLFARPVSAGELPATIRRLNDRRR